MTQDPETQRPDAPHPETPRSGDLGPDHLRMVEAILFAATEPLRESDIAARMPDDADVAGLIRALVEQYEGRGVNLVKRGGAWLFQTAPDLAFLMRKEVDESKRLSRAAVETLAIVAYHQPVSRADIEDIRGVSLSKGTLDLLMEAGWVKPVGRREVPGRPVVYGTTAEFLAHFGLESIKDLPGVEELKAAGLLEPIDVQLAQAMTQPAQSQPSPSAELETDDEAEEVPAKDVGAEDVEDSNETVTTDAYAADAAPEGDRGESEAGEHGEEPDESSGKPEPAGYGT